jgi:hypothetical protein
MFFSVNGSAQSQVSVDVGESIVAYAMSKEGKKVKRGECWDLVAEALDDAGADWARPDNFGESVQWQNEDLLPGDIIEFRNVKIKSPDRYSLEMPQHFAIVVNQLGAKQYRILHQNYNGKKRVSQFDIDLNYMTSGRVKVYRPAD